MQSIAPLVLSIRPSRRLLACQLVAHVLSGLAVLLATLPSWLAAVLLLAVGASAARLRRPLEIRTLVLRPDRRIELIDATGAVREADVDPHTTVISFLVVLLFRTDGRSGALTLAGDSMAAEDFRHLRVWLRWYAQPS